MKEYKYLLGCIIQRLMHNQLTYRLSIQKILYSFFNREKIEKKGIKCILYLFLNIFYIEKFS